MPVIPVLTEHTISPFSWDSGSAAMWLKIAAVPWPTVKLMLDPYLENAPARPKRNCGARMRRESAQGHLGFPAPHLGGRRCEKGLGTWSFSLSS